MLRPDEPRILSALGVAQWRLGNYDEALNSFSAAVKIRPEFAQAYAGISVSYYMLNKFSEAQQALHKAIDLNPESSTAHFNLAVTCIRQNARDCALEQYGVLKSLSPDLSEKLFGNLFGGRTVDARKVSRR